MQQSEQGRRASSIPLILTSGRLVEYEGGGDETRSNPWLAELQQEMFVEINPEGRQRPRRPQRRVRLGRDADQGAQLKVKAQVTERVGAGHRASCRSTSPAGGRARTCCNYYPEGAAPIVRGEAVNTATTYGYDIVT